MRKVFFLMCLCGFISQAQSQSQDIDNVVGDLIFLTEQYITPAANASVYQSSGGWYSNLQPKKKFEIEVSLQYNMLFVPKKNREFLIDESQLKNVRIQGLQTTGYSPTALGGDDVLVLEGDINGNTFEFDSPEGVNGSGIQHGQIQVGLGLWKETNLVVRYAPNIKINNTNYQSYGFGLSHQLNQWIKPLRESSYKFGLMATYSKFEVEDDFNAADLVLGEINSIAVNGDTYAYSFIASKRIKKFDFSAAFGVMTSKFDYKVGGEGELLLNILNEALGDLNNTETSYRGDINLNYNIGDFSINSMFTFGSYSNLNIGVNYNI